jgi:hypothetical protein
MGAYITSKLISLPYLNKEDLNQKYLQDNILYLKDIEINNVSRVNPKLKIKKYESAE